MLKRHRRVLIGDVIWWGFLSLLVTSLAIGAWLTPQEWHVVGVVLMIGVPTGFWAITITIILKQWLAKPDIILKLLVFCEINIGVWVDIHRNPLVRPMIAQAIDIFVVSLANPTLPAIMIATALDQVAIEVKAEPIKSWGAYSWEKPKAGLQKGKSVLFHWPSCTPLSNTAFVHELLHLIDELVRGKVDYKHEDIVWWEQEGQINRKLKDANL